jgi:DnaJ-class molecular chaperone
MSDCVKEIGHRQVYDILQSRKPRAAYDSYGESGFCPVLGRVR